MDSPHISKVIRFLDCSGQPLDAPGEWSPALIELQLPPEDWESVSLSLQQLNLSARLTKIAGRTCILADWPLANPGCYELHARLPHGQERLVVTVPSRKIKPAALELMLLDLEANLPAGIAMALQRLGALAGVAILPPAECTLSQQMNRLRRAIRGTDARAGLAAVLQDLAERPHQILRSREVWVKAEDARRPHPAKIKDAICRGYNRTSSGSLQTVLDTRVEHTFDVYENRLLLAFTSLVEQRLRRLLRAISAMESVSPLAREGTELSAFLGRARRHATFLAHVSLPRHLPTVATMVLLNQAPYRAAFQGYLEFHKSAAVRIDEPRLDAPLQNVPFLYQLWGTLAVIQVLLEVAGNLGYRVQSNQLVQQDLGGLCVRVLPDGKPAVVLAHPDTGTVVKLIPERTYGTSGRLRSISFQQRPDIALEITSPAAGTTLYLFDPKYKLDSEQSSAGDDEANEAAARGRPKKVDIDKMHSYRDAIRDAQLRRVVRYAAILYPGPEVRYADDIEALQAYPGQTDKLTGRLKEVLTHALNPLPAPSRF